MSWLRGWRLPLRLARREALRARGRSILVLVMIALPVLAVTAAAVVMKTQDVSTIEGLDRRLGAAQAEVEVTAFSSPGQVLQAPDPNVFMTWTGEELGAPLTAEQVSTTLGGARLVPRHLGYVGVVTSLGVADVEATEIDLDDPLAVGLFDLTSGRWPQAPDEVVVNAALAAKGYAVGDPLDLSHDVSSDPTIVGVAESTTVRDRPVVAGPPGSLGAELTGNGQGSRTWLVDGAPVTWAQVRELNQQGAVVLSRAVVTDPPPLPPEAEQLIAQRSGDLIAVVVLVIVMALLEVVLLAGPAFAVGARRQSRSLALMAAAGGTPTQSRRVVLAGAVVLGGVGAALGVGLGIATGWAAVPLVQRQSAAWFGPFEVPWRYLAAIAAFGLLSALLAAVVPAWIASRQDVVAVLAGRRGDRKASLRSPLAGLVLLGVGVAGAVHGARAQGNGELFIAGSAIFAVLGMVLLVPVVLVVLSKVSGRLPLVLRYAVRDAARHRSRTVPAVAAVAATVAGVVALGIATSSDEAQYRATYVPSLSAGTGVVTSPGAPADWDALQAAVERAAPGVTATRVDGVVERSNGFYTYADVTVPGIGPVRNSYGSTLGSSLLVSAGELPPGLIGISDEVRRSAQEELAAGGVVVLADRPVDSDRVRIRIDRIREGANESERTSAKLPAYFVSGGGSTAQVGPQLVISPEAARTLAVPTAQVGIALSGKEITASQEADLSEIVGGISNVASLYVERGYQASDQAVVIQLILGALGAVLMLGGTLTATFLALSDARPDLATLSAVGASPRTRRGVAAAYAVVVGAVGALIGAVIGFIPGIAITYPLTYDPGNTVVAEGSGFATSTGVAVGPFLDIPWLLIATLVVGLPLLTALVVGVAARSRLPLVARLD